MNSLRRIARRCLRLRVLLAAAMALAASTTASAQLPMQYTFGYGTGELTDMTDATMLLGDVAWYDDVTTDVLPIGFTFRFQGVDYTEWSASSNGLIRLGPDFVTWDWTNDLDDAGDTYPIIANYWEDLVLDGDPVYTNGGDAGIFMKLTGTPGSRVLTVEWRARRFGYVEPPGEEGGEGLMALGEMPFVFQTRLYERTNAIEFVYSRMSNLYPTSGSIGIASAPGTFLSVTPGMGSPLSAPTVSSTVANDTIQLQTVENRLPAGTLYSFTPTVMAEFTSNGAPVGPGTPLFTLMQSCVGDAAVSVPLTVRNTGLNDLVLSDLDIFRVDSTDVQGELLLMRDAQGRPIASPDYIVTDLPGTAPMGTNIPAAFPDTLAAGEQRTLWVAFVGQTPGRRLARLFLRTNATTFASADTANVAPPELTEGLLAIDLVGQAVGGSLARNLAGERLRTVVFPDTRAGDTAIRSFTIVNSGACDLRINRGRLRIFSGDVNEYRLLSVLPGVAVDAVRGDYVIAPGDSGTITVAFMPVRSGTRMATVFMQTNDSTLGIPGITERGSYYLDLHGRGRAGLDARDLVLRPVVIGGFSNGIVEIENTSITTVDIARIVFEGLDSAEFSMDTPTWPALPAPIVPGQKLQLGVRLTPAAGSAAGIRRTTMVVVTTTGDTLRIRISGEAGTQSLVVSPSSLFDDVNIVVGSAVRRTVMISNTGTLPVRLTRVEVTGADSANYRLGLLPRMDLDPGQTEFLEVTFAPTAQGQSSAVLEISSTAGGVQTVTLGGTALRIRRDPADPALTTAPTTGGEPTLYEPPTLR